MPNVKKNDQIYKHLKISSAKGRSLSVLKLYWFLRNLNIPLFDYIDIAYLGDRPTTFVFKNGGESGNTVTTIHIGYVNNLILYVLQDPDLSQSVQTTPTDPSFSSVSLLLHMNGANGSTTFVDSSSYARPVTSFNGAQISTAQSKFGNASGFFDGTNDYARVSYNSMFNLSTGDWTIEAWFRASSFASASVIISKDTNGFNFDWCISFLSSTQIRLLTDRTRGSLIATVPSMAINTWHHVAIVRFNSINTIYLNGVSYGSNAMAITNESTNYVTIGCAGWNVPNGFFSGYIDDLRVSKVARYTSNFTSPTAPFPDS